MDLWEQPHQISDLKTNSMASPFMAAYLYLYLLQKEHDCGGWRGFSLNEDSAAVVLTGVGSPSLTTLLLFKEVTDVFRGHHLVEKIDGGQK